VPRILLAEANVATREIVQKRLVDSGFDVYIAADAAAAPGLYAAERPDAVVLAVNSPGAAEAARLLRRADPRLVLVALDHGHLEEPLGAEAVAPLMASAYVESPLGRELADRLSILIGQATAARARLTGVAALLARAPAAAGDTRPGVVAQLIHQVWRSTSDGVLVLEGDGRERRLFFLRGTPVAVESSEPTEALAGWFDATGRLDEAARDAVQDAVAGGLSAGAALIAAGVVEPGEGLQAALRAHVRSLLVTIVGSRSGRWRFHVGDEFTAQLQPVEVLPLAPLLEGARAHLPVKHFADALKAVLDAAPVRTAECAKLVTLVGLGFSDQRLLQALDGRPTTKAFLEARKADLKEALSLLWFLSLIGALVFHETSPSPAGEERPGEGARPRPPLPPDRAEAVRQAALRILPGTYFHALGVDIAADSDEVERAYRDVAERFHPDAFSDWEVGDLNDLLLSVQDKVTAAHRVLVSEEKRRQYLSFLLLKFELAGVRSPGIVLDAELALKRGERALRARRHEEAIGALRQATELNPREPEYLAMLGFAELHAPGQSAGDRSHVALASAGRALELDPGHPRALVVTALAEALAGRRDAARQAGLRAVKAHPASELAQRTLARVSRLTPGAGP
jgi:tetratricopeptide (TPR) repeat protein/AmiR/NasT family two-component response regulator